MNFMICTLYNIEDVKIYVSAIPPMICVLVLYEDRTVWITVQPYQLKYNE